ncbi:MAG: YvrJ family protein [Syntrophomonadaceae bacterium]
MSELLNLAANVGFPMVVAAYLLIRIESQLKELTLAINQLREAVLTSLCISPLTDASQE